MTEKEHGPRWRSIVVLAVVAAAVLTTSVVVARAHSIHPDTTPGKASSYPPLLLQGRLTKQVRWAEIETSGSYDGHKDSDNRHEELQAVYRGQPLYELIGLVDDDDPGTFNVAKAKAGYGIKLVATDHYTWTVDSRIVVGKDDWIVASLRDDGPLPKWEGPYRFVGPDFISFRAGQAIKRLVRIKLLPGRVESQTPQ